MAEYIERSRIGLTDFEIILCKGDYKEALKMLLDKIETLPAADVRPVARGKWIKIKYRSICRDCSFRGFASWNFCPNCGAMMEES